MTIDDLDLKNKRVLVRVDFNVPTDNSGRISDDSRIAASLPTIGRILEQQGKAILMSHLGRPKEKKTSEFSLRPCAERLERLLDKPVGFVEDCIGAQVRNAVASLKQGACLMLENLRFHSEEEKNDPAFAKDLASLGEVYVNDAFGTAHRAHASTVGVTKHCRPAVAGYLMQRELEYLDKLFSSPSRPLVVILGGAKVSDKISVIENFLDKADVILIGGAMAFTFVKAKGGKIGSSLVEENLLDYCKRLLEKSAGGQTRLLLPVDVVVADSADASATEISDIDNIPVQKKGLDIGPQSCNLFDSEIRKAKTIVWNGPVGMFEKDAFAGGTACIAKSVAKATSQGAISVAGGGETAAALARAGVKDHISHISTGGGAFLEYLEGKVLPGVAALDDRNRG